jgi:hypothetical protein
MKNKNKTRLMYATILVLVLVVLYNWYNPKKVVVPVEVPVRVEVPVPVRVPSEPMRRAPEYRGPPIKQYKPGHMQQMGLLVGPGNETLPLYGKEARGYRDRYNYYTTTSGEQMYPVPVTHEGRECTEDIGCPEFYGNESVDVLGKEGAYNVKMYRTDDFF